MDCKHRFQGHKDGVTCLLCGLRLSTEDYLRSLKAVPEVIVGPVDTADVKPVKRTRSKKKEAAAHE